MIKDRNQEIVKLRLFKRMSYKQLADLFGISTGRVHDIIKRCYRVMCRDLERLERLSRFGEVQCPLSLDDLPIKARNALRSVNVQRVEDLGRFSEADLLDIPNIGLRRLRAIARLMHLHGISFR